MNKSVLSERANLLVKVKLCCVVLTLFPYVVLTHTILVTQG